MHTKLLKKLLLLIGFGIIFLTSCLINNSKLQTSIKIGHFNSYVERISEQEETRYFLTCDLDSDAAKFTGLTKYRYLISRDTIYLSESDKYVINNYSYFDSGPWEEIVGIEEYKDLVVQICLNSKDTVVEYMGVLCEKRMFDEMYENIINSQR